MVTKTARSALVMYEQTIAQWKELISGAHRSKHWDAFSRLKFPETANDVIRQTTVAEIEDCTFYVKHAGDYQASETWHRLMSC
jgi:hypothetical protein